jgi:predicted CXXCH cytochrome family protein
MLAACVAGMAFADISTTRHAFVKSAKRDRSDLCVFCHTPNVSGTPPDAAPVWQKSVGTALTFTIYDDIGRLGLGKSSVGSQSVACLSCHDSNQAQAVTKGGASDHPFGVPYRGATKDRQPGNSTSQPAGVDDAMVAAKKLVNLEDFRDVTQGTIEDRTVWWVSPTGASGGRRTRSDLPLYTRNYTESGENLPFIECSSCHDPHSNNQKFLRVPNEGSKLCLTCHIK